MFTVTTTEAISLFVAGAAVTLHFSFEATNEDNSLYSVCIATDGQSPKVFRRLSYMYTPLNIAF